MQVKRTQEEVDEALNKAAEAMDTGSKWPGMSYEEGVYSAIEWLLGYSDNNPMEDE